MASLSMPMVSPSRLVTHPLQQQQQHQQHQAALAQQQQQMRAAQIEHVLRLQQASVLRQFQQQQQLQLQLLQQQQQQPPPPPPPQQLQQRLPLPRMQPVSMRGYVHPPASPVMEAQKPSLAVPPAGTWNHAAPTPTATCAATAASTTMTTTALSTRRATAPPKPHEAAEQAAAILLEVANLLVSERDSMDDSSPRDASAMQRFVWLWRWCFRATHRLHASIRALDQAQLERDKASATTPADLVCLAALAARLRDRHLPTTSVLHTLHSAACNMPESTKAIFQRLCVNDGERSEQLLSDVRASIQPAAATAASATSTLTLDTSLPPHKSAFSRVVTGKSPTAASPSVNANALPIARVMSPAAEAQAAVARLERIRMEQEQQQQQQQQQQHHAARNSDAGTAGLDPLFTSTIQASVYESMPIGVMVLHHAPHREGHHAPIVNPVMCALTGRDRAELGASLTLPVISALHLYASPEEARRVVVRWAVAVLTGERTWTQSVHYRNVKTGAAMQVQETYQIASSAGGVPLQTSTFALRGRNTPLPSDATDAVASVRR